MKITKTPAKRLASAAGVSLVLALPSQVYAHYIPAEGEPTQVHGTVMTTWRSASPVDQYEFWQIPGTFMGGDAWPVSQGVSLDEVSVMAAKRLDENTFVKLGVSTHDGSDGHQSVGIEHASIGFVCCDVKGPWVVEVGRMSAAFSPELLAHRSTSKFTEPSLIADVFFGRHFHDQGIRIWLHETAGWSAGAEIWQGKAFPATDGTDGGAWDAFARYSFSVGSVDANIGAWHYRAQASSRADHRYGGGHQHTPVAAPGEQAVQFPDVRYTGDLDLTGVHAGASVGVGASARVGIKGAWAQLNMEGILHDSGSREADVTADQYAVWVQPYLTLNKHTIALRAERFVADNTLTGAAAETLGEGAGALSEEGHTPERFTAAWLYQWRPQVQFRTEYISDQTFADGQNRYAVGVVWQGSFFNSVSSD